jgi:hypothetical protein
MKGPIRPKSKKNSIIIGIIAALFVAFWLCYYASVVMVNAEETPKAGIDPAGQVMRYQGFSLKHGYDTLESVFILDTQTGKFKIMSYNDLNKKVKTYGQGEWLE